MTSSNTTNTPQSSPLPTSQRKSQGFLVHYPSGDPYGCRICRSGWWAATFIVCPQDQFAFLENYEAAHFQGVFLVHCRTNDGEKLFIGYADHAFAGAKELIQEHGLDQVDICLVTQGECMGPVECLITLFYRRASQVPGLSVTSTYIQTFRDLDESQLAAVGLTADTSYFAASILGFSPLADPRGAVPCP